jgi:hypothetical protein
MLHHTPAAAFIPQATRTPGKWRTWVRLLSAATLRANGGNLVSKATGTTAAKPTTDATISGNGADSPQRRPASAGPAIEPTPAARFMLRRPLTDVAAPRTAWLCPLVQKRARAAPCQAQESVVFLPDHGLPQYLKGPRRVPRWRTHRGNPSGRFPAKWSGRTDAGADPDCLEGRLQNGKVVFRQILELADDVIPELFTGNVAKGAELLFRLCQ